MANRDAKLIERTLKDFSLGAMSGNGGSTIVDALPAKGVEGTTYLLRKKEESGVFKAQAYALLYSKVELPFGNLVFIDADFDALEKSIETKLDPSLSENIVDFRAFSNLASILDASSITSEEWNHLIEVHKATIVTKEEDVLQITANVDFIVQDLGKIGIENLNYAEPAIKNSETYLAGMQPWVNTLTLRAINQNNKIVEKNRTVLYNPEGPSETLYSFTEWREKTHGTVVGTFTDTYEYDRDTLMNLGERDCYFITLTPETPTYSYTQYVFDQGVYTVLGEGGGSLYTIQVKGRTGGVEPRNYSFTTQVDSKDIHTFQDLLNYLTDKEYYFHWSSGEGEGFILQAAGMVGYYKVLGIFTYSGNYINLLTTEQDGADLDPENTEITYLGE